MPEFASNWSTPGAFAFNAPELLSRMWLPGMIGALTLGPLGERMTAVEFSEDGRKAAGTRRPRSDRVPLRVVL